jgi:hypothetical protein
MGNLVFQSGGVGGFPLVIEFLWGLKGHKAVVIFKPAKGNLAPNRFQKLANGSMFRFAVPEQVQLQGVSAKFTVFFGN